MLQLHPTYKRFGVQGTIYSIQISVLNVKYFLSKISNRMAIIFI